MSTEDKQGNSMLQEKKYIKRCTLDRRSSLDRRILNLGPVYPSEEKRMEKDRRKGWEDRLGWISLDRSTAFNESLQLNLQLCLIGRLNNLMMPFPMQLKTGPKILFVLHHNILQVDFYRNYQEGQVFYKNFKFIRALKGIILRN